MRRMRPERRLAELRQARERRIRRRIERPPAHWSLLALSALLLLALLVVNGLATHGSGQSGTPAAASGAGGVEHRPDSAVGAANGEVEGLAAEPGRRVALTFEDGPDSEWTPQIAELLLGHAAPATFFVTGQRALSEPHLVRELANQGFALGNHTFSHVDVSAVPDWRRRLEISSTDTAIAGAAGVRTRLFRPPYASTASEASADQRREIEEVAREGYVVTLADFDSRDWERPGVSTIVRSALPPGRTGGIILMHDGGGDRSQTVAALDRLIPALRVRGFRIVPLAELLSVPASDLQSQVGSGDELRGRAFVASVGVARGVAALIAALLIPIAVLAVLRAAAVTWFALHHARSTRRAARDPDFTPPVSVIVPAFNEAELIQQAITSLARSDYPDVEVVLVDDGSEDGTADLVEALGLVNVRVIRQANAGKAAALNAGLAATNRQLVVMVDADTVFEPVTLRRLVQPFRNPAVGAAAGNTKVGNRKGVLGRWQHIDYVTGFNLDRRLYEMLRCMPTVPGAIGAFRREALEQVGGLSSETLAEDTDVTIAIGRLGWDVVYVEDAKAYTETPPTLSGLWRQRYRWSYGTMQAVWKHRAALARREPGKVGRRGLPYLLLFQVALPALAPLIDVFTIYGILFLDPLPVIGYWLGFNLLMLALAILAFRLDGEPLRPLVLMPLQQFVYRQLMYLVVIQSAISAVRGVRLRWQHVERRGELETA